MTLRPGELATALAAHGLRSRGGFAFGADDAVPEGPYGRPARFVVLVGHAGGEMWPHFTDWRKYQPEDMQDPLDAWSKQVIGGVAERYSARAVFPSDRPYLPFQQWAIRAEGLKPSPLGILIHPQYGLWHAFRGALLFEDAITLPPVEGTNHPCAVCSSKPCLNACPVDAFSDGSFAVERCRAHVRSQAGRKCRETGCLARNACPVGAEWRYTAAQQAFHQRAFSGRA
ncbi:MAG: hypothetical protein K8H74_02645 [Notoacmeibacter sp.]|nr:hypothetical protein [Notoacmeibacter sp.]